MKLAKLATEKTYYDKIGIKEGMTQPWEDGMRTNGGSGTFEWWYIDAEYEEDITIVNVFYTKDGFDFQGPAHPRSDLEITFSDGRKIMRKIFEDKGKIINAAKDKCNVKIGTSSLIYDNGKYYLDYEDKDIKYHVVMEASLPMWRPDTGHIYFGEEEKNFFAWFVAQPASIITGTLEIDGKVINLKGKGYHDHNWGNVAMNKVINHWYWGRAKIGDYNVIACDIITEKKFNNERVPIIMIAKNGEILEDDQTKTKIYRENTYCHEITGKLMDNKLKYIQPGKEGEVYTIEFNRKKDIITDRMIDKMSPLKRTIAKLLRVNPTYTRILGVVTIEIEKDGNKEIVKSEGLWEQMYLGKNTTIKNGFVLK